MQVIDDSSKRYSDKNSVREIISYPSRGEIFDRNGIMIARNREAYNLMVIPQSLKEFDTAKICSIIGVDKEFLKIKLKNAKRYSSRKASTIISQLSHKTKLIVEELDIAGLSFVANPVRRYPYKSLGNIFGYLGEVSVSELRGDSYYTGGDFLGKIGMEKRYETHLRGEKGYAYKLVDVHGVIRGDYDDRSKDIEPVQGAKITTTIDIELQELGHKLMSNKIGAIVAIEPSSGEILAMVTAPTYDPDSLVGITMNDLYKNLADDPRRPLFNRAIAGRYSPGSTFKIITSLIALEENVTSPKEKFHCDKGWSVTGRRVKCHAHRSPLDMEFAIQTSCNSWFCSNFRRLMRNEKYGGLKSAFNAWSESVKSFGYGIDLGIDMDGVGSGFIPDSDFYNRMYNNYWNDVSIISLCIGQGEITATPLQIANSTAILANRGYYKTPHIIRSLKADSSELANKKIYCDIDSKHFESVVSAMWKSVNTYGTGTRDSRSIRDLNICGKSGTIENNTGKDHSSYIAFAPKDNPKIAIVVYVENGGWGNAVALPIATLMIEKYLRGEIERVELLSKIENIILDYPQYADSEINKNK